MADTGLEELPLYLAEPEVRPARLRIPPGGWPVLNRGADAIRSTLVMTRILPLPPATAVDSLMAWWRRRAGSAVAFGSVRFDVLAPDVVEDCCDVCRMGVRLHRPFQWRDTPLELELSPWSSTLTEVDLRPLRWRTSPSERYFAAGHALLHKLERDLIAQAGRRPVIKWRRAFGTG